VRSRLEEFSFAARGRPDPCPRTADDARQNLFEHSGCENWSAVAGRADIRSRARRPGSGLGPAICAGSDQGSSGVTSVHPDAAGGSLG
jgi:hypothetical protein